MRPSGIPTYLHGVGRGDRDHERLRVRHPDVLGRADHDPARDEPGVLAGLDHSREVVQRGVGVGTPDRLDERADHVVVLIALPIVAKQGAIDRGGDDLVRDHGLRRILRVGIGRMPWPRTRPPRAP